MSTPEDFFFGVRKVEIFIQESGFSWKRHHDHLTNSVLELQPVNAQRQREHTTTARSPSACLNMAVKRENVTGSGIFVSGNINNFRELLYKAIYGSYEKLLGVRRLH